MYHKIVEQPNFVMFWNILQQTSPMFFIFKYYILNVESRISEL